MTIDVLELHWNQSGVWRLDVSLMMRRSTKLTLMRKDDRWKVFGTYSGVQGRRSAPSKVDTQGSSSNELRIARLDPCLILKEVCCREHTYIEGEYLGYKLASKDLSSRNSSLRTLQLSGYREAKRRLQV